MVIVVVEAVVEATAIEIVAVAAVKIYSALYHYY